MVLSTKRNAYFLVLSSSRDAGLDRQGELQYYSQKKRPPVLSYFCEITQAFMDSWGMILDIQRRQLLSFVFLRCPSMP